MVLPAPPLVEISERTSMMLLPDRQSILDPLLDFQRVPTDGAGTNAPALWEKAGFHQVVDVRTLEPGFLFHLIAAHDVAVGRQWGRAVQLHDVTP
ncbi:hypothetical protein METHP14_70051 [Pseudomonas sp. P14-2025]